MASRPHERQLLAFLDADDMWPAGKLARQVERLEQEPTLDVVLGRIRYVTVDGAYRASDGSTSHVMELS